MEETPTLVIHGDTRGPWDIPRITGRILCMVKSCNCGLVQKTVEDSRNWIRTKQVHFQKGFECTKSAKLMVSTLAQQRLDSSEDQFQ